MGIVVCVAMLLGVLMLVFKPKYQRPSVYKHTSVKLALSAVRFAVVLLGVWNAAWYGLSNLETFWGKAALISGLFMIAAGLVSMYESKAAKHRAYNYLQAVRWLIILGLIASFLLYFISLVQLNLGYPIIQ